MVGWCFIKRKKSGQFMDYVDTYAVTFGNWNMFIVSHCWSWVIYEVDHS